MDEQEEQRKKDIGSRASDLYSAFSKARMVGALASTSEIWGPIALAIIIIAIPTFLIVLGGQGAASEVPPAPSPSISPGTVSANVHFYCQYDSHWTSDSCNITSFGCDPTSLAMILSSFGRTDLNPSAVSAQNGNMGCDRNGTNNPQIINSLEWAKSLGFIVENSVASVYDFDVDRAKKFIDTGYLILGIANVKFKTNATPDNGGHSFVITDVDPKLKKLTVLDPTYCSSDSSYEIKVMSVSDIFCDRSLGGMCGWLYALPIKK